MANETKERKHIAGIHDLVLPALTRIGEGSVTDVIDNIKAAAKGRIKAHQPIIQLALKRFREKGYVSVVEHQINGRGRPKIIYRITADGKKKARRKAGMVAALFQIA